MTQTATPAPITDEQAALIGNRWEGKNGTVRYYINDWAPLLGLELDFYGTGNLRSANLGNQHISNAKANVLLGGKVYVEGGKLLSTIDWAAAGVEKPAVGQLIRAEIARRQAA